MKTVQYFSKEYLEQCKDMSSDQIVEFVENFRSLLGNQKQKTKLISIKIPEDLLAAFKQKSNTSKIKYQTMIKKLMQDWVIQK